MSWVSGETTYRNSRSISSGVRYPTLSARTDASIRAPRAGTSSSVASRMDIDLLLNEVPPANSTNPTADFKPCQPARLSISRASRANRQSRFSYPTNVNFTPLHHHRRSDRGACSEHGVRDLVDSHSRSGDTPNWRGRGVVHGLRVRH